MTAILAVVQEGRAWVGADSRASGLAFRDDAEKVFIEGGWLWGVAGHSAQACWLRAKLPRQAPDASDANRKGREEAWKRWKDALRKL